MIEKVEQKSFDDEKTLQMKREKVKQLETEEFSLILDIASRQTLLNSTLEKK